MAPSGMLRAWIEQYQENKVIAAFIGVAVLPGGRKVIASRQPATHVCSSPDKARQWIENEASAVGLPVEWVESTSHTPA